MSAGEVLLSAAKYAGALRAYEASSRLMGRDSALPPEALKRAETQRETAKVELSCEALPHVLRELPAGDQRERIRLKLEELHGHSCRFGGHVEDGVIKKVTVVECLWFQPFRGLPLEHFWANCCPDGLDLSPLKGMSLKSIHIGTAKTLTDLRPLRGMPLERASFPGCMALEDLGPLRGMPLRYLDCMHCQKITDLRPLAQAPLEELNIMNCGVRDLSPLSGKQLTRLDAGLILQLRDISALRGMPLEYLNLGHTGVSDLSPLTGMPLERLRVDHTRVTDLTPLRAMELELLTLSPEKIEKGTEIVRSMKSLKLIGAEWNKPMPADEFWKRYDAGEFR